MTGSEESETVNRKHRLSLLKLLTSSDSLSDDSEIHNDDPSSNSFLPDFGLMVTIDGGRLRFHLCPDANFPDIHPNVYAPAALAEVETLAGGGSGGV